MATDEVLRAKSKHLIDQLRTKQGTLGKSFTLTSPGAFSSENDVLTISDLKISSGKSSAAKKLLQSKTSENYSHSLTMYSNSKNLPSLEGNKRLTQGVMTVDDCMTPVNDCGLKNAESADNLNNSSVCTTPVKSVSLPSTPTSVRKGRQIIDRHVIVENGKVLSDSGDPAHVFSTYRPYKHTRFADRHLEAPTSKSSNHRNGSPECELLQQTQRDQFDKQDNSYYKNLTDTGNDRKRVNFIKDTTIKPKSILNSMGPYSAKKRNSYYSKVSFQDSSLSGRSSTSFLEDKTSKQLLGYDWIASLIDNDPTVIDQSEAFFEDLRDFRRVNREECENRAYMEGPLSVTRAHEPSVVKEALETKVKPFTVNERLFTVPIHSDLLSSYVQEPTEDTVENKEPSYDAPRFVRVSIPRSTLSSPHRYKPHRRRSFDPTDSMALGEHCLLGWESSRPATMPTASNIGLKDATDGVKTKIATTLEEAEKVASSFYWPNSGPPNTSYIDHRLVKDTMLQQRYNSLLEGLQNRGSNSNMPSLPSEFDTTSASAADSIQFSYSLPKSSKPSTSFSKSSDQLLNSTYSLIYEMERLKQDADSRLKANTTSIPVV